MASNVGDKFVPLSGGLDLIGSAINKVQGTLIDCQNVESAPYGGYRPTKMELPFTGEFVNYLNEDFYQVLGVITGSGFGTAPVSVTWDTGSGTGKVYFVTSGTTAAEDTANKDLFVVVADAGSTSLDGTSFDILNAASPGSNFITVDAADLSYKFSSLNIRRGRIRTAAHRGYHFTRATDIKNNFTDGPSITSGLFTAGTDVFMVGNDTSTATADQIYKATTGGWTLQNPGQEMAFNDLEFEMRYEHYTIWNGGNGATSDANDLDHDGVQANSALDTLDYFPGRIIYWVDDSAGGNPQDDDIEYWAEVEHNYIAKGAALEEVSGGAVAAASWVPIALSALRYDDIIDGFDMASVNRRVLIKNQENASENGIYVVSNVAPVRATDFDSNEEIAVGILVNVTNGTRAGGRAFVVITDGDLELDSSGIEFAETAPAEGAFSLYGVHSYHRATTTVDSGGANAHSEADSGTIPLSETTGAFGKWTEANALNFTSGSEEPSVGDQLVDSATTTNRGTVLKIFLDSGTWAGGDATGTVVLGRLYNATTTTTAIAAGNMDIVGGTTNVLTATAVTDAHRNDICHNTSTNIEVSLPTRAELVTQSSRYVSSEYNFAASDGSNDPVANKELRLQGTYICNGAGLAMVWDNTNSRLVRIRTGAVVSADRPRHSSIHADRLMLGYGDGTVVLSVVGEPKNFRGIDGAATFGVSSGVTGLSRLNGKASAVFTESTIDILYGTDTSSFTLDEFSDGNGAIEYTVVDDFGTFYCDRFGVSSLEAAEKYGDFDLKRLSRRTGPWLGPRLLAGAKASNIYPDSAVALPSSNQYKLIFKDGRVLIMTFVQGEDEQIRPEFTFQTIYGVNDLASNPITASAQHVVDGEDRWYYCTSAFVTSSIDNSGAQIATRRMDASPLFGAGVDKLLGSNQDQDGGFWFVVGPIPIDHPRQNSLIDEFIISGHHTGWLPVGTAVYEDFEDVEFIDTATVGIGNTSIWQPRLYNNKEFGSHTGTFKDLRYTEDYVPQPGRGRYAYLVLSCAYEDKDNGSFAYQTPSDRMTFQNMIVRYGKGRRQQN